MDCAFTKRFVKNVNEYVSACGFKKGKLEMDASVSLGYLSRLEKSECKMSLDNAYRIATCLGVTLDDLMTGKCLKDHWICEKQKLEERIRELDGCIENGGKE